MESSRWGVRTERRVEHKHWETRTCQSVVREMTHHHREGSLFRHVHSVLQTYTLSPSRRVNGGEQVLTHVYSTCLLPLAGPPQLFPSASSHLQSTWWKSFSCHETQTAPVHCYDRIYSWFLEIFPYSNCILRRSEAQCINFTLVRETLISSLQYLQLLCFEIQQENHKYH